MSIRPDNAANFCPASMYLLGVLFELGVALGQTDSYRGDCADRINADATGIIQLGGVVSFHSDSFGGPETFLCR